MAREMKIGIASFKDFKKRTISIAGGAYKPNNNEPTVWFDSIESMAQVLSSKNQELLKKIRDNNPESLAELAILSGRQVSNLSRTLKNMEKYGIVELNKGKVSVKPLLRVDTFRAIFSF
ncbi:MAG: transcriptional regulator [Smithella sp.]|jgi:predicted transcriptional regulator|nr:transcriptional regulator [Smithella sp.]